MLAYTVRRLLNLIPILFLLTRLRLFHLPLPARRTDRNDGAAR